MLSTGIAAVLFIAVSHVSGNQTATAEQNRTCQGYTRDGHQCSLAFIYKGVSYHTCTDVDNPPGRYWCSLTPDFDADKQWKRCAGIICDDCKVYATNGRKCIFPFVYKGKTYNYCTTVDNQDNLWCAHSSVYNGQWGKCGDTLCGDCTVNTEQKHQCKFPFYYKGIWYEHCTRRDNPKPWCSLNGRSNRRGVDWDNCIANVCPEHPAMPVPPAATDKNTPRCSATLGYSSNYSAYTVNGKKCALPFIYKGVSYPSATDVDNSGVKWCSLTHNYDRDGRWERYFGEICSGCTVRTENNGLCHFPFEYKGKTYTYCSKVDNPRLWCSFDPVYNNRWGPCTDRTECPGISLPTTEETPVACTTEQGSHDDLESRYCGCFLYNDKKADILSGETMNSYCMTVNNCINWCAKRNWTFAGAEKYYCNCGNDDLTISEQCGDECVCDQSCPSNSSQICGGNRTMSVYEAVTLLPTAEETYKDLESRYLGCYLAYHNGGLILLGEKLNHNCLTANMCINYCAGWNFTFAGIKLYDCFCGNDDYIVNGQCADECICPYPCPGDGLQECGGGFTMSVYGTGYPLPTTVETPVADTTEQGSEGDDQEETTC